MLRRLLAVSLCLGLLAVTAPGAAASTTQIDQSFTAGALELSTTPPVVLAQSFRAGLNGKMPRVDFEALHVDPGIGAQLQTTTPDGLPSGTVLASTTVSSVVGWTEIQFDPAPTVVAGTTYALVLTPSSFASWKCSGSGTYSGGSLLAQLFGPSTPWDAYPDYDCNFRTWVTTLDANEVFSISYEVSPASVHANATMPVYITASVTNNDVVAHWAEIDEGDRSIALTGATETCANPAAVACAWSSSGSARWMAVQIPAGGTFTYTLSGTFDGTGLAEGQTFTNTLRFYLTSGAPLAAKPATVTWESGENSWLGQATLSVLAAEATPTPTPTPTQTPTATATATQAPAIVATPSPTLNVTLPPTSTTTGGGSGGSSGVSLALILLCAAMSGTLLLAVAGARRR